MTDRDAEIITSWNRNADAWARAVREKRIPSRVAGTDRAILDAVRRVPRGRVLDAGCGEGWLARALGADGYDVTAIDASEELIARARELGGGRFSAITFDALIGDGNLAAGRYDAIVLNFALLGQRITPLLDALGARLSDQGVIIIQTVHPWTAAGDQPYRDGWRVETFDAFGGDFAAPMPWFFRTLESWVRTIGDAGLRVQRLEEPVDPDTGRQLSLLLTLRREARP
jgi:2-polyprenyl-3-methyl-5-hydroxy-6-metoxy-1,4-benzoquinol methylase